MKRQNLAFILLAALVAMPVFAGNVYVPYTAGFQLGDVRYHTEVTVSNNFPDIAAVAEHKMIPMFTDGTVREEGDMHTPVWMNPGQTRTFDPTGDVAGMLEVVTSDEVYVQARLVPVGDNAYADQGVDMPVISSDNMIPAGETVQLQGMERGNDGASAYTSFGYVNLGHQAAVCSANVFRDDGVQVVFDFALDANALSVNIFRNVLQILGQTSGDNWRIQLTCDQDFYAFLMIKYPETSRITFVTPAPSGKSTLSSPGDGGGGGGASDEFIYLTDLPIDRWGGIELRPFVDSTGIDFHGGSNGNTVVGGFADIKINGTTYERGLSFYGRWSTTPFVEFRLNGEYALFTAMVRLDDYARGRYEWAIVSGGRWQRLQRPSDGFRGRERDNPIRVGGSCTFNILGDGQVLFQGPVIYAHRDAVYVEIDVTGVDVLRFTTHPDGWEVTDAPYRNGLSADRLTGRTPWWDLISFADTKLYLPR